MALNQKENKLKCGKLFVRIYHYQRLARDHKEFSLGRRSNAIRSSGQMIHHLFNQGRCRLGVPGCRTPAFRLSANLQHINSASQRGTLLFIRIKKVKVAPYTFVRRGVPVGEDTYPEPLVCEVGRPVPFLAAFISPVLSPGTHLLLGEQ